VDGKPPDPMRCQTLLELARTGTGPILTRLTEEARERRLLLPRADFRNRLGQWYLAQNNLSLALRYLSADACNSLPLEAKVRIAQAGYAKTVVQNLAGDDTVLLAFLTALTESNPEQAWRTLYEHLDDACHGAFPQHAALLRKACAACMTLSDWGHARGLYTQMSLLGWLDPEDELEWGRACDIDGSPEEAREHYAAWLSSVNGTTPRAVTVRNRLDGGPLPTLVYTLRFTGGRCQVLVIGQGMPVEAIPSVWVFYNGNPPEVHTSPNISLTQAAGISSPLGPGYHKQPFKVHFLDAGHEADQKTWSFSYWYDALAPSYTPIETGEDGATAVNALVLLVGDPGYPPQDWRHDTFIWRNTGVRTQDSYFAVVKRSNGYQVASPRTDQDVMVPDLIEADALRRFVATGHP
ncbi:MAG: hypothetical protein ACYCW6_18920, partial [Candidatus Xenobia bacterium]